MKNKFKLFLIILAISAVFLFSKEKKEGLQDLVLSNIEALAENESGNTMCIGQGSIDCLDIKVEIKITGYR